MIDNLDEAIVAVDQENRIVALNALAVELFQLDGETAPGNPFEWLVKHSYLEQDILDTPEDWKTVVNIGERQCYMTFASVELSGITTRIVRFRDVNRAQANDSNMRRLLYQSIRDMWRSTILKTSVWRTAPCRRWWARPGAWPPRITPSSSPARAAPERSCWPPPSTMRPHGQTAPSWPPTLRPFRKISSRANYSAMRKGPSPVRRSTERPGSSSWPTQGPFPG